MAGLLSLSLMACEDQEEVNLFAAQQCLDTATAATAQSCVAKLSGNNSQQAYILRCAADFVAGGITTSSIATALENIDKAGTDPTAAMFSAFQFQGATPAAANAAADAAAVNCNAAGSDTLKALVNTARLATLATTTATCIDPNNPAASLGDNYTPGNCSASADSLASVLKDSQASMCGENGAYKDNDICTNLNAAIAANPTNNQALIDQFLANAK